MANTLNLKRELARSGDADLLGRLAGAGALLFDGLHDIHALQHLAEHSVLAYANGQNTDDNIITGKKMVIEWSTKLTVQPRGGDGGDEELGALSVGASVGHAEVSRLGVLDLEVLI